MRCIKCNKFLGLAAQGAPLKDKEWICNRCLEELGFNKKEDAPVLKLCTYDLIKDGKEAYQKRQNAALADFYKQNIKQAAKESITVKISSGSERPDVDATEQEFEIFEILQEMVAPVELELKRTADDYVVAKIGTWYFARFKFTDRTAWISFPPLNPKNKNELDDPEDVRDLARKVDAALVVVEENS